MIIKYSQFKRMNLKKVVSLVSEDIAATYREIPIPSGETVLRRRYVQDFLKNIRTLHMFEFQIL